MKKLKNFYRITWPISTKLSTKHPWVKRIQVCSDEGPGPFPKGDTYKIAKIHWQNLKIFFCRTIWSISTKLVILGLKDLKVLQIRTILIVKKEMSGFRLFKSTLWYNHSFEQMCLLIWTGFSGEWSGPWASCLSSNQKLSVTYSGCLSFNWWKHFKVSPGTLDQFQLSVAKIYPGWRLCLF